MKRFVCAVLVLILVLSTVPAFAASEMTVYNCKEWVSLRKTARTTDIRLDQIPLGATVTGCTAVGSKWIKCTYNGQTGYVLKKYLKTGSSAPTTLPDQKVVNCNEWVSLRLSKSTSSTRLAQVPKGAVVTNCEKEGSWVYCCYNGQYGFIKAAYLTKNTTSRVAIGDQKVYNVKEWVSLRTEMSTSSSVAAQVPKGETVTDCYKIGSWVECVYNGKLGYIKASYLKNATEPTPAVSDVMVVVKVNSYVNLRSTPSTKASSIGTVKIGESVTACSYAGNGFIECTYKGKTGYVLAKYLKTTSNTSSGTAIADQKVVKVNEYVSLRQSASTSAKRLAEIPLKAVVTNCVSYGTWVKCDYKGQTGYVLAKYLTNAN